MRGHSEPSENRGKLPAGLIVPLRSGAYGANYAQDERYLIASWMVRRDFAKPAISVPGKNAIGEIEEGPDERKPYDRQ